MFARVNAVFGVRDNARVIPEEAIVPLGGRQFVIKLLGKPNDPTRTTQRVEVKVGLRSPGKVEILEGLEPGDTVVTTGQQRVQRDGTAVAVVDLANTRSARPAAERPAAGAASAVAAAPAAASAASSAAPRSGPAVANAPAALSGPNPCGVLVSEAATPAPAPTRNAATPERRPASPAGRDPA